MSYRIWTFVLNNTLISSSAYIQFDTNLQTNIYYTTRGYVSCCGAGHTYELGCVEMMIIWSLRWGDYVSFNDLCIIKMFCGDRTYYITLKRNGKYCRRRRSLVSDNKGCGPMTYKTLIGAIYSNFKRKNFCRSIFLYQF